LIFKNKLVRVQQKKKRKEAYREVFVVNRLLELIKSSNWKKFNISRRWAYHIRKKRTGYHPHAFRHSFCPYASTVKRKIWKLLEDF